MTCCTTQPRRERRIERLLTIGLVLATAPLFVLAHHLDPSAPHAGVPGWWGWIDQSRYIEAARAWASLSLDPARHWYFPGYPLLAAPFMHLAPDDPFYGPDLLCLLAASWLFAALGPRLAPHLPGARPAAALVFLAQLVLSRPMLRGFVEPWTTTPAVPLAFASLLLAFRFQDRPDARAAAALGLAAAAALPFRPVDAVLLAAVMAVFAAVCLAAARPDWRRVASVVAAGTAGAAVPVLLTGALHLAVHGWTLGGYLAESRAVGFEWRLLPLRWVIIAAAADPLLDGQRSLSQAFVWIIPGLAGMASCLAVVHGRLLARHIVTIAAALAHVALYLSYRDLEPQGLMRFGNYHYFMWPILLLGLYAALLIPLAWPARHAFRAWSLGIGMVFLLFSWQARWTPAPGYPRQPEVKTAARLTLDGGLHALSDAILVHARGDFDAVYFAPHRLDAGQFAGRANVDFKLWPIDGGFLLSLRRPLLDQPLALSLTPAVTLDPAVPPSILRAQVVPALPWWMRSTVQPGPAGPASDRSIHE